MWNYRRLVLLMAFSFFFASTTFAAVVVTGDTWASRSGDSWDHSEIRTEGDNKIRFSESGQVSYGEITVNGCTFGASQLSYGSLQIFGEGDKIRIHFSSPIADFYIPVYGCTVSGNTVQQLIDQGETICATDPRYEICNTIASATDRRIWGAGDKLNFYNGTHTTYIIFTQLGTVNTSSNISGANWTITGPSTKTGSGTSASYGSMPVGTYTITWGAVGGYNAPGSNSQTLTSGGTINFSGSYTAIPPTTSFTASPASIAYNTASTLTWSSTNATGCTAGGAWSGAKAASGTAGTGNLTSSQTYTLYCTGAGGNSSTQSVTVTVNPISDLTAGSVTPTSATTGVATTFSATISNIGTASTGASFTNLFQFDSNADHTAVDATRTATAGPIATGSSANAPVSYTFPTAGAWYVRACADNNASWVGTITESNEGNNCGAWTNVAVTTPVPTGSITPSNCTITSGSTCTASIAWTTSNVASPSIRNNGIQFSTSPSSAGTPVTLNYGINTLTLYDGATWLDTKYASGFAADQGTTGSAHGGSFATAPTADLCTSGTASAVTVTGTGWTWTCGSGVGLVTGVAIRLGPVCGDNMCESGESLLTCPQDCKIKYQQF